MTDPVFDKEGNLSNLDELDRDEVAAAYQEKNRSLFGRLTEEETKRKEAEANVAKAKTDLEVATKKEEVPPPVAPVAPVVQQSQPPNEDELRLVISLSKEEVLEARDIAKGKNITFTEALETPLFKLYQQNLKETTRKEDAKLPASRGSNQWIPPEGIKAGMTKEEHQKLFKKAIGQDTA